MGMVGRHRLAEPFADMGIQQKMDTGKQGYKIQGSNNVGRHRPVKPFADMGIRQKNEKEVQGKRGKRDKGIKG